MSPDLGPTLRVLVALTRGAPTSGFPPLSRVMLDAGILYDRIISGRIDRCVAWFVLVVLVGWFVCLFVCLLCFCYCD